MEKPKRKNIKEKIKELHYGGIAEELNGFTMDQIKKWADKQKTNHPDYNEIIIEFNPYGYDGGFDTIFFGIRKETYDEYNNRIIKEKKEREKRRIKREEKKQKEYEEFLRLKKKFEK
ncbi:MAG: hypothetical protein ACOC1O_00130 [bacterium]